MTQEKLNQIVSQFSLGNNNFRIQPLGEGLINITFLIETDHKKYVLQSINNAIFQDVELLQNNIYQVTTHIAKKLKERGEDNIDNKVLKLRKTTDGKLFYFDGEKYWRIFDYIQGFTHQTVNPEFSYYTGQAIGDFQAMLSDIKTELGETIPKFHNMEFRLEQFREAISKNKAGRVAETQYYIDELLERADNMCKAERLHREGTLPKRISHCDTKVNNVMFDADGKVLCVIDLDTVMPSFVFSDFGDFMRTAANTGAEDDQNLDNVSFNMEIFKAFTKGYLETAYSFLTPIEVENLPYGATLFQYMQAVRFLTDYLNGDTYYSIKYPTHNLDRTKAQFKLLQDTESKLAEMSAFIKNIRV